MRISREKTEHLNFNGRQKSESVGSNGKGRPPGRWKDRVKEYMCERGATRGGGMVGSSKEGVFGQGEVETFLP